MATVRIFKHYIRVPFLILGLVEVAILVAAVYGGAYLRYLYVSSPGDLIEELIGPLPGRAGLFAAVMLASMISMGLYQAHLRFGVTGSVLRLVASFLIGIVGLTVFYYLFPNLYMGRGATGLALMLALLGVSILRVAFYKTVETETLQRRVLVYGAGRRAANIRQLRRKTDLRGFKVMGYVHIPGEHNEVDGEEIVHLDRPLQQFAVQNQVDEIVMAVNDRRKNFPVDELLDCRLNGIEVVDPITFFERETGKLKLDLLYPSWMIFSDGFSRSTLRDFQHRFFDVVASSLLLFVTWPVMVVTALAILLESGGRGPVLYRQVRVGQNGQPFELLKFRSMTVEAEGDGKARWAQTDDERITRVGAVLRRFRIDELPQMLNVLRGDMSFVGPRPERPEFVNDLSEKIPYYSERHRVKPGITGWAQLRYPYGASEKDAVEKLQYDLYYVKNRSLFLDLLILLQTAEIVLLGKGVR